MDTGGMSEGPLRSLLLKQSKGYLTLYCGSSITLEIPIENMHCNVVNHKVANQERANVV
jgi:hypothetical protein